MIHITLDTEMNNHDPRNKLINSMNLRYSYNHVDT